MEHVAVGHRLEAHEGEEGLAREPRDAGRPRRQPQVRVAVLEHRADRDVGEPVLRRDRALDPVAPAQEADGRADPERVLRGVGGAARLLVGRERDRDLLPDGTRAVAVRALELEHLLRVEGEDPAARRAEERERRRLVRGGRSMAGDDLRTLELDDSAFVLSQTLPRSSTQPNCFESTAAVSWIFSKERLPDGPADGSPDGWIEER
jgi:hypothetical protein